MGWWRVGSSPWRPPVEPGLSVARPSEFSRKTFFPPLDFLVETDFKILTVVSSMSITV